MKTETKSLAMVLPLIIQLILLACGGTEHNSDNENLSNRKSVTATTQRANKENEVSPTDLRAKGVGPVKEFKPGIVNTLLVKKGAELFAVKCAMCHKMDTKLIGPPLAGVTSRHSPEWVLNMLLVPDKMIAEDPAAKALYELYQTPMINQQLKEEEAKAIYDYLRKN